VAGRQHVFGRGVTASVARYPCSRCGKRDVADRMIFSTFTRNRYCRDMTNCDRRFHKNAKEAA
jgi:deoxycytidylate deaminase